MYVQIPPAVITTVDSRARIQSVRPCIDLMVVCSIVLADTICENLSPKIYNNPNRLMY